MVNEENTTIEEVLKKGQEVLENQNKLLQEFKEKIKGKVVVLYGQAWIGKSLFTLNLSKLFSFPKLFLIDNNYTQDYFNINPKIQVVRIEDPKQLDQIIQKEPPLEDKLIIIDSITTLQTSFISKSYFSPRAYNEFNNFSDKIAKKLSELKPKTTSILIAHEKIQDWDKKIVVPRINFTMLRNCDVRVRMYLEDGQRKIRIEAMREVPKTLTWVIE
jgi:hypothetical protein